MLATPAEAADIDVALFGSVPLTGITLDAALKMRCDLTGAAYAVYWARVDGTLRPIREYVKPERSSKLAKLGLTTSYADASVEVVKQTNGAASNVVTSVWETGQPAFFRTASSAVDVHENEREVLVRYGIGSVSYESYEGGVIETGTEAGTSWRFRPVAPKIPKAEMRKAFEELGALYVAFWAPDPSTGDFTMHADYETPRGSALRARLRGDGDSFVKRSKHLRFHSDGHAPVPTAGREGAEVVVVMGSDGRALTTINGCTSDADDSVNRANRAADMVEFGLSSIHFIPVDGGVFEYGVPTETTLSGVTLDATLALESQAAGAGYAIYWTRDKDNKAVVAGSYTRPEFRAELASLDRFLTFPEASESFSDNLDDEGSPVAEVLRTRKPVFIGDVAAHSDAFLRRSVALDYNIKSIAFLPTLGGVIEIGTSNGPSTKKWDTLEHAQPEQIPNAAIERAFIKEGATYAMFWSRNFATGVYDMVANFESTDSWLNRRRKESSASFTTESGKLHLPILGDGPVASTGRSGVTKVISDVGKEPSFRRQKLAQEWGVGKMTLVPCATGVLEYGTVTKDKRLTTTGSEYQETARPYRRDIFDTEDWERHRANKRFRNSMRTLFQSGIFRAKYAEVLTSMLIAAFVTLWNHVLRTKWLPFLPALALNLNLFTLTAPSLGLLLVFRTNTCYGRWDEARKCWGSIINKTRNMVRQANSFFDDTYDDTYGNFRDGRRRVAAETSAFARCLRCFLRGKSDEPNLRSELKELGFTPEEIAGYMSAGNRQVYALSQISSTIRTQRSMDSLERSRMDTTLSQLLDDLGACERIFKTPIPRVYTAHTARFTGLWLFLLPFALAGPSVVPIFACGVITFFMLGIEELGVQIEEPFSVLPIEAYCDDSIGGTLDAMVLAEDMVRYNRASRQLASTDSSSMHGSMRPTRPFSESPPPRPPRLTKA